MPTISINDYGKQFIGRPVAAKAKQRARRAPNFEK